MFASSDETTETFRPLARLTFSRERGVRAIAPGGMEPIRLGVVDATVLEVFAHRNRLDEAFALHREAAKSLSQPAVLPAGVVTDGRAALLLVGGRVVLCGVEVSAEAYRLVNLANKAAYVRGAPSLEAIYAAIRQAGIHDMTEQSSAAPGVAARLALHLGLLPRAAPPPRPLSRDEFQESARSLIHRGLLVAPPGRARLGDLRHNEPLCPDYGFSRGTPIDRYYLSRFMGDSRQEIRGRILEIGGRRDNLRLYRLPEGTTYRALDLAPGAGVDIVGDSHDPGILPAESFDSVLILNVLEHCARPWAVVENVHRWLAPGGKVFGLVPNAQRVHRDPIDCWRILPDGLRNLFGGFERVAIRTYGSLLTTVGALAGLAAEEFDEAELAQLDPRYPVTSCVVAEKRG